MLAPRLAELAYRQFWQLAVMAGIVWALLALTRKRRPHLEYLLWGAVLVKAMTPPLWASSASLFGGFQSLMAQAELVSVAAPETRAAANFQAPIPERSPPSAARRNSDADVRIDGMGRPYATWTMLGFAIWGAGAAALASGLMVRYGRLIRATQRSAILVPDGLRLEVAELSARLGLARPPQICLTTAGVGPAVAGVLAPRLILPAELWRIMSPTDQRLVLTHELMHLARRDPLAAALQTLVQIVWWFHPAVWYASREFSGARELCCDVELLSRESSGPSAYARCLLRVALHQSLTPAPPMGLVLPSASRIQQRIAWITSPAADFARRTPWSAWIIAGLLLMLLLPSQPTRPAAGLAAAEPPAAEPSKPSEEQQPGKDAEPRTPSPELIAVTWQQIPDSNNQRIEQPVWRPDGTQFDDAKANRLLDQVGSFQTHWWNKDETLRPLVLVFRMPPKITGTGMHATVVIGEDRRFWGGTWGNVLPNGLAKSACSPQREALAAWPDEVNLDLKIPIENRQVIKRLETIPDQPIELAPGVRWYIDHDRGIDRSNREAPRRGLTAAVLEIEGNSADSLVTYGASVWLRGQEQPLAGDYATNIELRPGVWAGIYVSRPIDDLQKIERVEFTRQRFRIERIEGVKTRLDLLPAND